MSITQREQIATVFNAITKEIPATDDEPALAPLMTRAEAFRKLAGHLQVTENTIRAWIAPPKPSRRK